MARLGTVLVLLFLAAACSEGVTVVPLLGAAGVPLTQPITVPLEVVTRSTAVADPLPVRGTDVAYGDVEAALGHAIASATVPWAERHRSRAKGTDGWQLFVEITNAEAEYDDGRVIFAVGVRATLRARAGNIYLAQSQASCRQGALVRSDRGAPVMYRCMMEVGHDLAGWLDGVDLDAVASSK
ncbi:MAG TPA: hypothetical protein VGL81_03790 [Polyangiaceae bacterium]|jgi:hypothetical protein